MIIDHRGKSPSIAATARIAPGAVVCGHVTIGENTSVGFGTVITAESGPIEIGRNCVIMDTAVLRGVRANPLRIADNVLVGPRAYLTGCMVEENAFLATGATVFNGSTIRRGAEVRINGIVHIGTVLPEGAIVPLGWIAIGNPAQILPPEKHDEIWAIQSGLNFPKHIWGVERRPDGQSLMPDVMPRYAAALRRWHESDRQLR
jgi:carbonic anhydrase/acetyltransferase-like protein (isoleucine patch superfamily)